MSALTKGTIRKKSIFITVHIMVKATFSTRPTLLVSLTKLGLCLSKRKADLSSITMFPFSCFAP